MIRVPKRGIHMGKYDTIAKHLVAAYPIDFVCLALEREDVEFRAIIETELPKVETRLTDSLILVRIGGEEALVHTEFQTTDSKDIPIRMASYTIRLIEYYGLPVFPHVIYLQPDAGRRDEGIYLQEHPDYPVLVRYKVIRLSEIEGRGILEGGQPGLLPYAPLMKRPAGMDSEAWLRQCIRRTKALDRTGDFDFLGSLAVLSGLAYEQATIKRILSQEGLMDAIMRESSFAQYLKELGVEQGIEQGREEGGRERAVEDILDVLEIRFDPGIAGQFAGRIRAIDDLQRLKQLHRSAVQVNDPEAFQRLLNTGRDASSR